MYSHAFAICCHFDARSFGIDLDTGKGKHKRKSLFKKNKTQIPKGGNDRNTSLAPSPGVAWCSKQNLICFNQSSNGNQGQSTAWQLPGDVFSTFIKVQKDGQKKYKKYILVQVGKLEFVECALEK